MKLLVSALEPSANLHLKPVLDEVDHQIVGIYDKRFGDPIYDMSQFSVMGFLDVLPKIRLAKRAIKDMVLLAKDCDSILLIDAPSFNLRLAKELKRHYPHKKITYYILPKVWAWKKNRVKTTQKYCDNLASIFPFEKMFYDSSIYVGNPLLDEIQTFRDPHSHHNTTAFLPGSRRGEVKRLMPIFRELAKRIDGKKVLLIPPFLKGEDIGELYGDIEDFDISYVMQETLAHSDFAFICSGTATLEASIIGTPFVLVYKARPIDFKIAKTFVKLPYVGLANLILHFSGKDPLHPEFFQEEVNLQNLLNSYQNIDKMKFAKASYDLREILKYGSAKNVANLL
jgi:lipid-A-disaccharide synthase